MSAAGSERERLVGILAVHVGVALVTADISIASTGLPAIARGIEAQAAETIWVVNAYYLAVIAALLPLAALGEIFGHRRIFFSGLAIFALGSLACGFAWSLPSLAVARAVVGASAAAVSATTPALIRSLYPPERLGRGLGYYALVVGVAFSVAPIVTSAILSVADWTWLFLVNVPIALGALLLARRALPETTREARAFDALAALLCSGMFVALLSGIAGLAHQAKWSFVLLAGVVSVACAVLLRRRERGLPAPILAVDLFSRPLFSLSAATSVCAFAIQGLIFIVLPFLFQENLGYSQVAAGFMITPWPVTLAVMTLIAGPLADRFPAGILGSLGLVIVAAGLVTLVLLPSTAGVLDVAWRLVVCGIGFGLFQSPNMKAMMSSAPRDRSGAAGGLLAASRLFGQSLGAAAVGLCLSLAPQDGIGAALLVGLAMAGLGFLVSAVRLLPGIRP